MENARFIEGELTTHFIDKEIDLISDMKNIMERERPLEEKLSRIFEEKRKIAAASAIAALTHMLRYSHTKQQ